MKDATDLTIFSNDGFTSTLKIAEALVKSGILPRGIDNPFKAFAIIQKGREIGVGPMRALTGIHLIEGKAVVSPELKLEQFKARGGRVKWVHSDDKSAQLHLRAANGDEHTETVTIEEMKTAGVAHKDNWKKYPKSMLRARCTGFGLRALGEGDGSYTPDEMGMDSPEEMEQATAPEPEVNVPALRKGQESAGAPPRAVTMRAIAVEAEALDAEYRATINGTVAADEPAQARIIDDKWVEVINQDTGEVTKEKRPTPTRFKRLQSLRRDLVIKEADWLKGLAQYSVDSSTLLTAAQCDHYIARLEKWMAVQNEVRGMSAEHPMVEAAKEVFNVKEQDNG